MSSREERYYRRQRLLYDSSTEEEVEEEEVAEEEEGGLDSDLSEPLVVLALPVAGNHQAPRLPAGQAAMPPVTRLKYRKFFGDGEQDVDDWYEDFSATAEANQEDADSTKRVFGGLLKDQARKWLKDQPNHVRNDFDQLRDKFLLAFRESGGEARAISKLNRIRMKSSESVLKYGQRLKDLIRKLATEPAENMKIAWYVDGFPEKMSFQIRREKPTTLTEAMEAAQDYESSAKSLRRVIRKEEKQQGKTKHKRNRKGKSKKEDSSGSSVSSSSTGYTYSESDSEESSEEEVKREKSRSRRDEVRTGKVKKEKEDSNAALMKTMVESLEAIKINLADNRKARRAIPLQRENVWCGKCNRPGHFNSECTVQSVNQVEVNQSGHSMEEGISQELIEEVVYQVQSYVANRNQTPKPFRNSGMAARGHYCYCCGSPDHYANVCPERGQMLLLCQNCRKEGHTAPVCPEPIIKRVPYKFAEDIPRDQTALNYASSTGIANPPEGPKTK